jgi:hypothetical protein
MKKLPMLGFCSREKTQGVKPYEKRKEANRLFVMLR